MKGNRIIAYCIACFFFAAPLFSQEIDRKHLFVEGNVFLGEVMKVDDDIARIMRRGRHHIYNIKVGLSTLPSDSCSWASDYNYPVLGLGISAPDFYRIQMNDKSYVANIYSLYGFVDRTLIRSNNFRVNFSLEAGLCFAPEPYDPLLNPSNEFVSSKIMVYIGVGAGIKYRIADQVELSLQGGLKHYSNGRMGMPNKGMNIIGGDAGIRYYFASQPKEYVRMLKQPFDRKFYFQFAVAGGIQASVEEWELYASPDIPVEERMARFKLYPKGSLSTALMYRYSRKYGTGLGLELYYTPSIHKHKEWDRLLYGNEAVQGTTYNALSVGLSLNHEVYYKNVSLYAAMGYYLFRELGIKQDEGKFYQRAGFRYYPHFLSNLYIGYGIKAHNFRLAEYLELSIGASL